MAPLLAAASAHPLVALVLLLFLDGATLSCFTTLLLLHYGMRVPAIQAAGLGAIASALGSMIQYALLRAALRSGHPWLRRFAPTREKVERALARHRTVSFLTLVMARATPIPDGPLKVVAAWGNYPVANYGLAILLGALPYYYALARLGGLGRFSFPALIAVVGGFSGVMALTGFLVPRIRSAWQRRQGA